jgi:hypothetical protein
MNALTVLVIEFAGYVFFVHRRPEKRVDARIFLALPLRTHYDPARDDARIVEKDAPVVVRAATCADKGSTWKLATLDERTGVSVVH